MDPTSPLAVCPLLHTLLDSNQPSSDDMDDTSSIDILGITLENTSIGTSDILSYSMDDTYSDTVCTATSVIKDDNFLDDQTKDFLDYDEDGEALDHYHDFSHSVSTTLENFNLSFNDLSKLIPGSQLASDLIQALIKNTTNMGGLKNSVS